MRLFDLVQPTLLGWVTRFIYLHKSRPPSSLICACIFPRPPSHPNIISISPPALSLSSSPYHPSFHSRSHFCSPSASPPPPPEPAASQPAQPKFYPFLPPIPFIISSLCIVPIPRRWCVCLMFHPLESRMCVPIIERNLELRISSFPGFSFLVSHSSLLDTLCCLVGFNSIRSWEAGVAVGRRLLQLK